MLNWDLCLLCITSNHSFLDIFSLKIAASSFMGDSVVSEKKNKLKGILNVVLALVQFPSVFKEKKKLCIDLLSKSARNSVSSDY